MNCLIPPKKMAFAGLFAFLCGLSPASLAQSTTGNAQAELEAKYRSCSDGFYAGARPGRSSYTKDDRVWVVTPAFAKRFCMPPEFVDADLKGAEAISFKVVRDTSEIGCEVVNGKEVCGTGKPMLWFEILVSSDVALPRRADVEYWHPLGIRFGGLLIHEKGFWLRPPKKIPPGLGSAFLSSAVRFEGFLDGKVTWPIVALYNQAYKPEYSPGYDYYAFEGLTGFFRNPRMEKLGITKFAITFNRLGHEPRVHLGRPISDFAHVIELPVSFAKRVRDRDLAEGTNYDALVISPVERPNGR
jgi:hypothetical protein